MDCTHENYEVMSIIGTDETITICYECGKEI